MSPPPLPLHTAPPPFPALFNVAWKRGCHAAMLRKSVALYCASLVPVVCFTVGQSAAVNAIVQAQIGEGSSTERSSIILSLL